MGDRVDRWVRVLLWLLAVPTAVVGLWAQFLPRSFYDDFPGLGRSWVAVDGPYNEHLVRDVGGLNLGLSLVLAVAAVTMLRPLVLAAAGAALVYALPHFVYHASHLDVYETADQVANVVTLGSSVLAAAAVLALTARRGRYAESTA